MSEIYEELKDVTILCVKGHYELLKEYLTSNFPGRPIILWTLGEFNEISLQDNIHYISVVMLPYISGEVKKFIPGTWRYSLIISEKYSLETYGSREYANRPVHLDMASYDIPYDVPVFPKGCKVSFLNTEHLTDKNTLEYIKRKLSDKIDVYHHSLENKRIMGRGKYIPYIITDIETAKLKRYLAVPKKYDVCVVGSYSERRIQIVNKLLSRKITVLIIGAITKCGGEMYGDERDAHIGEARILLNIHLRKCWTVYESIRCERWRAAGMPIVSERCEGSDAPPAVIQCSYNDIVSTVARELAKLK
jgi:hypothetical protein